ncbi:MAG: DNA-processing protein DprA [Candidatus Saccharibacteria bacterium]
MKINKVVIDKNKQFTSVNQLAQGVETLFYLGDSFLELLDKPCVAIVGSRKVSPYGSFVTTQLATELARAGVVIISGLALGVDSIAHHAAVKAGGKTIAVLPCGLDTIYPASHRNLAKQILQNGGALVSEYDIGGGTPQKYQFIARNRIIAALSQVVLLTEAAAKSGSLHTAHFALELGIDVVAVPGNITSPTSAGTNGLLKVGAQPVTDTADILELLGIREVAQSSRYQPANDTERIILECLDAHPATTTELLIYSSRTPTEINRALTMLEINGVITSSADRWQRS